MRRMSWGLAILVVATAGCAWATPRFDRTNTGANPFETRITAAAVGELAPTFRTDAEPVGYPGATVLVHGRDLFAGGGVGAGIHYRSYRLDRTDLDCTDTAVPVCGPRWRTEEVAGDASLQEGRLFVGSAVYPVEPTSCTGTQPLCAPERTLTPLGAARAGDGTVPFDRMTFRSVHVPTGGFIETEYLNGYDAAGIVGCDADSCEPVWSILVTAVGHQWSAGTAVTADRVFVKGEYGSVDGYDASGDLVWQTERFASFAWDDAVIVNGHRLIITATRDGEELPRVLAFDLASASGCTGVPVRCAPVWQSAPISDASHTAPGVAGNRVFVASDATVLGFALDDARCPAEGCAPVWTAELGTAVATAPTIANGVVYVGTSDGVRAYDATGTLGCTGGLPRVCTSRWSALPGSDVRPPVVLAGRVMVADADGAVHVFALPG